MGLPECRASATERVTSFSRRLAALHAGRFYARSYAIDSIGTTHALLAWRDALINAGWDGGLIPGGGPRLDALASVERGTGPPIPMGTADRLVRLESELQGSSRHAIYDGLTLVEDRAMWSTRWRAIFKLLEERGAVLDPLVADPGEPVDSDLGVLQKRLRGESGSEVLAGDGSLLVLRGDTTSELAELTAALLLKHRVTGSSRSSIG